MTQVEEIQSVLDSLVGIEDALESIRNHVSLGDYIIMHKASCQDVAAIHYLEASDWIKRSSSVRKALNDIQLKIDNYR